MSSAPQNLATRISPDWKEIERLRMQIGEHLSNAGMNTDAVNAMQMVSCELLENAVKYGHYSTTQHIDYSLKIAKNRLTVEVIHPVRGDEDDNFRKLDAQIQWIRGFQNAFEAYIERLKEVSVRKPGHEGESGLGLVRIAYEGQSVLDFYVDDKNMLSVSAVYKL